jgi:guanylate kinase
VPKRHDNTIRKLSLRSKKTIKVILSSTTRIRLIVYMEDPKEAPGVDYVHIEEDTEVEETTVVDITTTTYPIRSDAIFIINLDTS